MTLTNAKIYIARCNGGHNDQNKLALAGDAIAAVAEIWDAANNWSWTLKDNYNTLITVTAGVGDYNAPADFKEGYTGRLLTAGLTLKFYRQREYDRMVGDQTQPTYSYGYTLFNSTGWTPGAQEVVLRLFGLPGTDDQLLIRYYRKIDGAAADIDIPSGFLYTFLDHCKVWYLMQHNAADPKVGMLDAIAQRNLKAAIARDNGFGDEDVIMKSQMDLFRAGAVSDPQGGDYFPGGVAGE